MAMLNFSACIEMMFKQHDFYDRFEAAANAGLKAVEFWDWCGKDMARVKDLCWKHDLTVTGVTVGSRNRTTAEMLGQYMMLDRRGIPAFVEAVKESAAMARDVGVTNIICTTGQARNDITRYEQHTNIVLALKAAAPYVEGVTLVMEPLNILHDHRGYYLDSSYEAFGIVQEAGCENIKVLYDVYHQQITEGNLISTIRKYFEYIGHIHIADVPGRHQPGTGEINYRNVLTEISRLGYRGYIGMEYTPTKDSAETVAEVLGLL